MAILSVMSSIISPRIDTLLQKAHQANTKGNLGQLRSGIGIYYSDQEGRWPMRSVPDGYSDVYNQSLYQTLVPLYMGKIPTPKLLERVGSFNGMDVLYDDQASYWMSLNPPRDTVILRGSVGPTPFIDRPYVYDPDRGHVYLCNGNYDSIGARFFTW